MQSPPSIPRCLSVYFLTRVASPEDFTAPYTSSVKAGIWFPSAACFLCSLVQVTPQFLFSYSHCEHRKLKTVKTSSPGPAQRLHSPHPTYPSVSHTQHTYTFPTTISCLLTFVYTVPPIQNTIPFSLCLVNSFEHRPHPRCHLPRVDFQQPFPGTSPSFSTYCLL